MKLKLLSILFVAMLSIPLASATGNSVTPTKEQVTRAMLDYNLSNQNNSYQLACEIGQYVSEEYSWNCDIRELNFTKHAPIYINVFYPAADNKKGYEAYYGWFGPQRKEVTTFYDKSKTMSYRDWGSSMKFDCGITGVTSYNTVKSYFGNESEQTTDPVPSDSESTQPVEKNDSGAQNIVNGSINTVNNQGIINTIEQYWFDFKNANLSNITFNFFGGH